VFVHGFLVNSLLWADVADELAKDYRVIAPDWPLGSHAVPLAPGGDRGPLAVAKMIADFLAALELEQVTLVGNDTGGAICQLVVVNHPERIGRLVLTPCDAFEAFPPAAFVPLFLIARSAGVVRVLASSMRPQFLQRSPVAYGWLSKRPIDAEVMKSFLGPAQTDPRVRQDIAQFLRGLDRGMLVDASKRFGEFEKPVLIAWAPKDRFFKLRYAERLAQAFPNARLERIEDSLTFVSIDQPERTAELIAAFAREPVEAAA
jgi:pimeloyl-ACP methyl ester carboxylesterase